MCDKQQIPEEKGRDELRPEPGDVNFWSDLSNLDKSNDIITL